jgi:mycothiol synthase
MRQLQMRLPDLSAVPDHPAGVAVRRAGPKDAEGLAGLLGSAFPEVQWSADRVFRDLLDEPSVVEVLVIDGDEGLLATASARYVEQFPEAGYVHWVGTDPAFRGRSLGRTACLAVLGRFRSDGRTAAVLETDDSRLPAIASYLGLGFVPVYAAPDHESRWSAVFRQMAVAWRKGRKGT